MGDFFFSIYQHISKNKKWSVLLLVLGAVGLSLLASNIRFEDDITALIPSNEETQRVQKVLKSISFTDKIIVNIERSPEASVAELTQYAANFVDSLAKQQTYIKNIQGKVNDAAIGNTLDFVYENLPLFLDDDDYETIEHKLLKDSIASQMSQNYRTLLSPSGIVAKKSILKDPLGFSFIALKKLQKLGVAEDFKLIDGFLVNKAETNILLFITPVHSSSETIENKPLSDSLYQLQERLGVTYANKVTVSYFGAALVAVANAGQIKSDIQFTVSIAMTLLLVLLILFYRKLALPFILFTPTLFGALLSLAFLYLFRGHISAISLGIGAILLGVTLDYALHILTHIRNGNPIEQLFSEVAPSILMSSLTTASAFLCLLFLESTALQDLGIFAAISVIGASVFALVFIPQVYGYKPERVQKRNILERIASHEFHKNYWIVGAMCLLCILSIFTYNKVDFNQDISKLNYESDVLIDARKRLEALTDIESKSIYLSTYGENEEAVLQQNDALFTELKQLKQDKKIVNYTSVASLIKSQKTQQEKLKRWNDFWNTSKTSEIQHQVTSTSIALGFKEHTFEGFYNWLGKDFKVLDSDEFDAISVLTPEDYIVSDENGTTITSLIKVADSNFDTVKEHFKDAPNTLLINRQQVNESFLGTLKNDFNKLLLLSTITVIIILFVFYRSLSLTLVTGIPIFITWFLTVGIMGLLHMEFNIFNIIICSFIFGLGVDYSIFITNGLLTEYRTGEKTLTTHKTSIILSVITTIAGVGVMIFAKHPVLSTISKVSLIGIFCAALVAFTLQPLLFKLFIGGSAKRPISLRYFIHSVSSFTYFGLGGFLLSVYAWVVLKIKPKSVHTPNLGFHKAVSKLMKSVLYTNPFVSKKIINPTGETFEKPAMLVANHTSFLDILCIGMLHPKIIFLVNDWVYNSPIFGSAAKLVGAYPVSGGLENGEEYLKEKVAQGFSLIAFPEGTRSTSNKIKRFHKGAFYLAEQFHLDIIPVLIHGNSEVLPKGSFVIRDGSITVEILPRITPDNTAFGENYTQQGKGVGGYFRSEFRRFRNTIEDEFYWHDYILENYRYKGDMMYTSVKNDLKQNGPAYSEIIKQLDEKATIIHLSEDYGQLDLLMALDSVDRKIHTHLKDESARKVLENNFLKLHYSKIAIYDSLEDMASISANVLILNVEELAKEMLRDLIKSKITTLILLKSSLKMDLEHLLSLNFSISIQNDNFIVLIKINA